MTPTSINFLIDTNVFIQLEDNKIISENVKSFSKLYNKHNIRIFLHPLTKEDIKKDKNNDRKKITLSKIDKYIELSNPPRTNKKELQKLFGSIKKCNDTIDCNLLYALHKNAIQFLVTEDINLKKRDSKLKDRILSINQAISTLKNLFEPNTITFTKIKSSCVSELNIKDSFFDSLKKEYGDFEKWFNKQAAAREKCWSIGEEQLEGLCIYKQASNDDYSEYGLSSQALKLATFKISENFRGQKFGELLLKQAFLYCTNHKYKCCWLTVFPNQKILIEFIKDFGFYKIKKTTDKKELIFVKSFNKSKDSEQKGLDFHIKYSPYCKDSSDITKYIIPIKPKYYYQLFPEEREQKQLKGIEPHNISGNTIKKIYISKSRITKLRKGDLFLFYVSRPNQNIRTINIIESILISDELSEIISFVGKRSVFSYKEIKCIYKKTKTLLIKFRFIKYLNEEIFFANAKPCKIIKAAPQSITEIANWQGFKKKYLKHDSIDLFVE